MNGSWEKSGDDAQNTPHFSRRGDGGIYKHGL
jgi:hypothetical protein